MLNIYKFIGCHNHTIARCQRVDFFLNKLFILHELSPRMKKCLWANYKPKYVIFSCVL